MTATQEIDPDIVTRLRNGLCAITCRVKDARSGCDCAIAADEIVRLRAALQEITDLCKREPANPFLADRMDRIAIAATTFRPEGR